MTVTSLTEAYIHYRMQLAHLISAYGAMRTLYRRGPGAKRTVEKERCSRVRRVRYSRSAYPRAESHRRYLVARVSDAALAASPLRRPCRAAGDPTTDAAEP